MTTARQQERGYGSIGFVPVLRRWWWLLVLAAVVAGACAYFITRNVSAEYESRVELLVGPINTDIDSQRAAGGLAQTYATLASSTPQLEQTIRDLRLPMTPTQLDSKIRVTANADTRVLTIRARDDTPELAATIANKLGDNLIALTSSGTTTRPEGVLSVIDEAAPGDRVSAGTTFVIALAAIAGFVGMLLLVLLIEFVRRVVRSEDEMAELSESPFLGTLGLTRRRPGSPQALVVESNPGSPSSSAYRLLATEIEYSRSENQEPIRSVLVTGLQVDQGVGEVGANLAAAFARGGRRVLLVDVDEAGEVTTLLGLDKTAPTEQADRGGADRGGADRLGLPARFRSLFTPTLEVVPRGTLDLSDMTELRQLEEIRDRLLKSYDIVVVAGSSVLDSAATLTWARGADCTILVAMLERTKRDQVTDAVESLRLVNARLVGTVLTESRLLDRFRGSNKAQRSQRSWAVANGGENSTPAAVGIDGSPATNGPAAAIHGSRKTRFGR